MPVSFARCSALPAYTGRVTTTEPPSTASADDVGGAADLEPRGHARREIAAGGRRGEDDRVVASRARLAIVAA